jgi:PAS domain S-box-containing protein
MRQLHVTTFGGLQLHYGRDCEVRLSTRKTAALIAYLCLHAGRRVSREALRGLLWADKSESQARHSLSQALSEARKAFGDDLIQTDGPTIAIDATRVWVDAIELPRLASENTLSSLNRAEAIYQGDFLAFGELGQERFDHWLLSERERLRQVAQRGLATALALRAGEADAERRLGTARAILALDPFDEPAHCALMQAYAAQGCAALAVDHYHQLVRTLRQELGVVPDQETVAIFRTVAQQAKSQTLQPRTLTQYAFAPEQETVATFQAIAERSQSQSLQPRTLAQYAFVLEQLPHPVVVTDLQSRIIGWNSLAEQTSGFTKTEICGRTPAAVLAPNGDPSQADSILKHALRWGRWSKRVDLISKNGQRSRQQRIVAPLFTPEGELIGAFGHGIIL